MEEFKDITGYQGVYQISDLGNVKSLKQGFEKMLLPMNNGNGYYYVSLRFKGKKRNFTLHRLVALHFIPNPDNLPEVNHLDGDKSNNAKSNLAWTDRVGNEKHARETRLKNIQGSNHPNAKLLGAQVQEIRQLRGKHTQKTLSAMFGVSEAQICRIQLNKKWA